MPDYGVAYGSEWGIQDMYSYPKLVPPPFDHQIPSSATLDEAAFLNSQVISYPGTPSPMYRSIVAAPLEVFSFKYGNPYSPVNEYDHLGRVLDIYAYDNIQWEAPLETFALQGVAGAAYQDATTPAQMIASQNLSAPTQAYSGQQGYGLP